MRYLIISIAIHALALFFLFHNYDENQNPFNIKNKISINLISLNDSENLKSKENSELIKPLVDNEKIQEKKVNKKIDEKTDKKIVPENSKSSEIEKTDRKNELAITKEKNIIEIEQESPADSKENISTDNSSEFDSKSESINSHLNSSEFENTSQGRIAKNQSISGLNYVILSYPEPEYPIQARKFRIKETVVIKTKFLIGLDGKVEHIEILEGTEKFGFRSEVEKTLQEWKFQPIKYRDEPIKLYFYKDFIFQIKN